MTVTLYVDVDTGRVSRTIDGAPIGLLKLYLRDIIPLSLCFTRAGAAITSTVLPDGTILKVGLRAFPGSETLMALADTYELSGQTANLSLSLLTTELVDYFTNEVEADSDSAAFTLEIEISAADASTRQTLAQMRVTVAREVNVAGDEPPPAAADSAGRAEAAAAEALASKEAAEASAQATAADRVQTGLDRIATDADAAATADDRLQTTSDREHTEADAASAANSAIGALASRNAADADAGATAADRAAVHTDRLLADADAAATAADRIQTDLDKTAADASAAAAAASAGTAAAISANVRNSLAPQAGMASDGSAASNRCTWALPASCALGTDPRGFSKKIETPAAAPSATQVIFTWGDAASPTGQFYELAHTSGDALRFRIYGATTADYRERTFAGFISNYGALRAVIITAALSSAGLVAYINGVAVTLTAETTGGSAPADWQAALTSTVAAFHGGLAYKWHSWFPLNFAPSLADALDIYFIGGGVPQRMKWGGAAVNTTSPAVYNPGGKTINSSTATVFDVTAGAVNNNCYWAHRPTRSMPAGQLIRLSGTVASISQPDTVSVGFSLGDGGSYGSGAGSVAASTGTLNTGGSTTTRFCENTTAAFSVTWLRVSPPSANVEVVINIRKTASASINSLKVDVLGALFFASPHASGDGCGYQIHDIGSNLVDGLMPTAGWSWTHPTQRGYIRGTTSTSGNQQLAGGVLLPANCQITRIRQKTGSGTPNTTLGTASGGTQLMASAAQSTTWKDETLALTGGINTAANSVWVGSNTTDTVYTHATYEILS